MHISGNHRLNGGALITLLLLFLICACAVEGQNRPGVRKVDAFCAEQPKPADLSQCATWDIYVHYTEQAKDADNNNITASRSYFILDTAGMPGSREIAAADNPPPAIELIDDTDPTSTSSIVRLRVNHQLTVPQKKKAPQYYLTTIGITFGGKELKKNSTPVDFETTKTEEEAKAAPGWEAADGRDDADIYLDGLVTRSSGSDFSATVDVKAGYPFFSNFSIFGRKRVQTFTPKFELMGSTDPDADPDSMKMGLEWNIPFRRSNSFFIGGNWKNSGLLESTRDFDNTNLIWKSRFQFLHRVQPAKRGSNVRFYVMPFIGTEVGKNINSPVKEAEGRGLARGIFGSTLNLTFLIRKPMLDSIGLEGSYERRLLLRSEVFFDKDKETKKLIPVFFGRRPREWVTAKLNFNFRDDLAGYIGYEYGEQPPAYNLVDHKMKIGLTFKIKRGQQ
jgi:hypothetical protein